MEFKENDISIIIPNWNGYKLLKNNLPAVFAAGKNCQIILVDDGSTDLSVDFVRENYPQIKIIEKGRHEGYVKTVNTGVAASEKNIVVLLNTDTKPAANFLKPLLPNFTDPQVFAVGCLENSNEGDKIIRRGRGLANWYRGFYLHSRGETDKNDTAWVSGGSGAFNRHLWLTLGGMDEIYSPFYWEDIDLSYRARKKGYKLIFEARSIIFHNHESGSIRSNYSRSQIKVISFRNQFLFIWKNLTDPGIWLEFILWFPVRLVQSVYTRNWEMILGFIWAIWMLPKLIKSRNQIGSGRKISDRDIVTL